MPEGNNNRKISFMNQVEAALKPSIADKGWQWEVHGEETDRNLWRINGMVPPEPGSDEEKHWVKENKTIEYKGAYVSSL